MSKVAPSMILYLHVTLQSLYYAITIQFTCPPSPTMNRCSLLPSSIPKTYATTILIDVTIFNWVKVLLVDHLSQTWMQMTTLTPTVTMPAAAAATTAILAPSLFCHPLQMPTMPWVLSITCTFAPCFMPDNSCIFYLVLMWYFHMKFPSAVN